jgi:hypothetical protein
VETVVIVADGESVAAIGPNPLDPARRRPALEAGRAQAAGAVARLASILANAADGGRSLASLDQGGPPDANP